MSEKKRQKKDGENKDKKNKALRESVKERQSPSEKGDENPRDRAYDSKALGDIRGRMSQ